MKNENISTRAWRAYAHMIKPAIGASSLEERAYFFGFNAWKTFIDEWFPNKTIIRFNRPVSRLRFLISVAPSLLMNKNSVVYIWSYKDNGIVGRFCERFSIPYWRVEDGFLRSVALGAERTEPLSMVFDRPALYFDATAPTTLENILNTYDFENDDALMERARRAINILIDSRLSKYNSSNDADIEELYGPKTGKRILVVGQVEGDMSIVKGCRHPITNNDLVRLAAAENPDAQIIYKPHPEVLKGIRKKPPQSNPGDVRDIALVLDQDVALADAFRTIDHVYTITSLSGFEALLRGISVTTIGCPFYAGWGLTDDRQETPRRTRTLTVEQVFAAAYILYPKYFDPVRKVYIELETAIERLIEMKAMARG